VPITRRDFEVVPKMDWTDFSVMPDAEKVNELYASLLEAQLVPSNVRTGLEKSQTTEKKWATVLAYREMMGNKHMAQTSVYGQQDRDLVKVLKNNRQRPDINLVLALKTRLSTANKAWMEGFIADQGIPTLLFAMEDRLNQYPLGELDAAILYELISCTKPIMNNGWTMDVFLSTKRAIRILTQSLIFEYKPLAIQVLEILSVVCNYSPEAAVIIVKYFRTTSRAKREAAHSFLVEAILNEDIDIKASIMLLFNQVFSSIDDLNVRMVIRSELKAVRCGVVCETVLAELELEDASRQQGGPGNPMVPTSPAKAAESGSRGRSAASKRAPRRSVLSERDELALSSRLATRGKSSADTDEDPADAPLTAESGFVVEPSLGYMAGLCLSGKNVGAMGGSILKELGSKASKFRYYELDKYKLVWWGKDKRDQIPKGQLSTEDILFVRPYTRNIELISPTNYTFEIETPSRVYTFACSSETDKDNWVTALTVA
jgi:hypothetical protein